MFLLLVETDDCPAQMDGRAWWWTRLSGSLLGSARNITTMDHQTRVYENVFEMMPGEDNPTPLVRVNRLNPNPEFPLYAKLEWMNPFGSVKDRAAGPCCATLKTAANSLKAAASS